ncbi:MAG: hypothetical protein COT74_05465 [Bdellovibrionales bacterium CG10_big_fil_rev_8_21_14_0_10_45_34]|nr:MAG: hypothetical protein COT74_05465 [Bdellovibrionales bacterium CG10_big_fil_rev_8_21_14_0_10_45_34]
MWSGIIIDTPGGARAYKKINDRLKSSSDMRLVECVELYPDRALTIFEIKPDKALDVERLSASLGFQILDSDFATYDEQISNSRFQEMDIGVVCSGPIKERFLDALHGLGTQPLANGIVFIESGNLMSLVGLFQTLPDNAKIVEFRTGRSFQNRPLLVLDFPIDTQTSRWLKQVGESAEFDTVVLDSMHEDLKNYF